MTKAKAEKIKVLVLGEVSGFARRDSSIDKILDILILAGIIEMKSIYKREPVITVNSIHNHSNAYECVGENFLGCDEIQG